MHDLPRQKLVELMALHGLSLCEDHRRCRQLLRQQCPEHPDKVNLLLLALEGSIVAELLATPADEDWMTVSTPLVQRFRVQRLDDNPKLIRKTSRWVIDSWGLALGKVTSKELPSASDQQNDTLWAALLKSIEDDPTGHWRALGCLSIILLVVGAIAGFSISGSLIGFVLGAIIGAVLPIIIHTALYVAGLALIRQFGETIGHAIFAALIGAFLGMVVWARWTGVAWSIPGALAGGISGALLGGLAGWTRSRQTRE